MNIGILGIGGVGGYFGGKLAAYYGDSEEVRIIFIARPATAEVIRRDGLKLISPEDQSVIHPFKVSSNADEIGVLDVLICATKSYDLEEALKPFSDCVAGDTLILPLLNGVNAADTIRSIYPDAGVLDGCVYVNAKRIAPAVIEKTGSVEKLYFGSNSSPQRRLEELQQIFFAAGIDSHLSTHIETDIWTKFVFIAGMANATSYFNEPIGEVLRHPEHRAMLELLVREVYAVAVAKSIQLPEDIVAETMHKISLFPFESTSSMHRDFQAGGKTEYQSLTKYIADLGDALGVDTPGFDVITADFAVRQQGG